MRRSTYGRIQLMFKRKIQYVVNLGHKNYVLFICCVDRKVAISIPFGDHMQKSLTICCCIFRTVDWVSIERKRKKKQVEVTVGETLKMGLV